MWYGIWRREKGCQWRHNNALSPSSLLSFIRSCKPLRPWIEPAGPNQSTHIMEYMHFYEWYTSSTQLSCQLLWVVLHNYVRWLGRSNRWVGYLIWHPAVRHVQCQCSHGRCKMHFLSSDSIIRLLALLARCALTVRYACNGHGISLVCWALCVK